MNEPLPLVVVGGGILGLALARRALQDAATGMVLVIEKEAQVAMHQTGRNSGVVHAGLYYQPGSLKGELCGLGRRALRSFCAEHRVTYDEVGKVVVATDQVEQERLQEILRRAQGNGVPGVRLIGRAELSELEPHVAGLAAIHSPKTAIVDYAGVARALAGEIEARGGRVQCSTEVVAVHQDEREVRVEVRTADGVETIRARRVVVCAGLHGDRVARLVGGPTAPAIVPFRGEYHALRADRRHLVRGLVYPVPDPRYPFLGIHLTRRFDGEVLVGPNAVLALAREGYRWSDVSARDLRELVSFPGFWRMAGQHWRTGVRELSGSLRVAAFVREAQRYVPALEVDDVVPARSGVRAQAVDRQGDLVDDFVIARYGRVVAVRNAPSPAATSSLAIADHLWTSLAAG